MNISVPEIFQNDPRYPLFLEPPVTSDDEETDSADSDYGDDNEIVSNVAVDDSQVSLHN